MVLPEPTPAQPGDDAVDAAGPARRGHRVRDQPRPGLRLSLRGVAREAALGVRRGVHRPGRRGRARRRTTTATRSRVEDPRLPGVRGPHRHRLRPDARRRPRWMARRVQLAGMRPISLAVDVTNYVMLELGQPIHGYDARQARRARSWSAGPTRGRAADHARRRRPRRCRPRTCSITDDSGPIGLAGVMGGETTELSATTTTVRHRGRALGRRRRSSAPRGGTSCPPRRPSASSAASTRRLPPVAADRVAELLVELRRRHRRARRDRTSARRPRRPPISDRTPACPPGSPACDDRRRAPRSRNLRRGRLRGRRGRRTG